MTRPAHGDDDAPAPGVARWVFGEPERCVPSAQRYRRPPRLAGFDTLPAPPAGPFRPDDVAFTTAARGCRLRLPLAPDEEVYGFGLQLKSFRQTGKKRAMRVNSDPAADTGDSHAPVPLYFSTAGYGVLVDTVRYAQFHVGGQRRVADDDGRAASEAGGAPHLSERDLYAGRGGGGHVLVDIPAAQGVGVYVFSGPTLLDAVRRYVLFSGGGAWPPMWGLGIWYRACATADQAEILRLADELRAKRIPCDVLGLEPGWQTRSYSCSFVWNRGKFPDPDGPDGMIAALRARGFRVNLWEHAFVHPDSPLHAPLKPYAGEYEVWNGLVPDFTMDAAAEAFARYHAEHFVRRGVDSFKLDECDNSDFNASPWSFPESARFPSGADGEQMHSMLGNLYQDTVERACRAAGVRTYGQVRSAHAFAAPLPFVLYSDLYDARDFIRGVAGCGFSGLLWTPELRHAQTPEDYVRRLQAMVLSPQMLLNIWSMPHPPWRQLDPDKNRAGEFFPPAEQQRLEAFTREILTLRRRFIPYLYAAFAAYHYEGTPPFRALAMDHPDDPRLRDIDGAWLAGPDVITAPFVAGQPGYLLPLPPGVWRDFHTGRAYRDEAFLDSASEALPIFVRDNTVLPLAEPDGDAIPENGVPWRLSLRVYGTAPRPARLCGDDGVSLPDPSSPPPFGTVDADGVLSPNLTPCYVVVARGAPYRS